jgi:hypothetical protein
MATNEGVVEAADEFGSLPSPESGPAGVAPDVVARLPDGRVVIGEAKYGTAWRAAATTRSLRALREWRYHGVPASSLVLAASAGHGEDAVAAARHAGWSAETVRLLEVSLPAAEGLDEARVEVTPATADEVERIAAELTLEQRRLVESGELVPVAVEAWASYADREFVTVPRRLGLLERDAFPDEVGRVVEDVTRQLHAQLTKANAHVSAWELRSAAQVDLAPQLVRWSVIPSERGGWDVRRAGATRASAHFETQAEARRRAAELAMRHGGGEVTVHTRSGRIREMDTIPASTD